jgi:Periplasmic binding protein domain
MLTERPSSRSWVQWLRVSATNTEVEYMVGTFDAVALAAADAIRQAGKANQIQVGGFDADAPNLELVRNGEIQKFDVTSRTSEPGWAAIDAAARIVNGEAVPPVTPVTTQAQGPGSATEQGQGAPLFLQRLPTHGRADSPSILVPSASNASTPRYEVPVGQVIVSTLRRRPL